MIKKGDFAAKIHKTLNFPHRMLNFYMLHLLIFTFFIKFLLEEGYLIQKESRHDSHKSHHDD